MRHHNTDHGLVLKKHTLPREHILVTIFSKSQGKIVVSAFGIKKITSRRLSHLETGNFIKFSYQAKGEFKTLGETDLIYGHSQIKEDEHKLQQMFLVFFVLNRILPEDQEESEVYKETLKILKNINNKQVNSDEVEDYYKKVLMILGFVDNEEINKTTFDSIAFIENLIGRKMIKID